QVQRRHAREDGELRIGEVAQIDVAADGQIDFLSGGAEESDFPMFAIESESRACLGEIEWRVLQLGIEQLDVAGDIGVLQGLAPRDCSAQDSFSENRRMKKLRSARQDNGWKFDFGV